TAVPAPHSCASRPPRLGERGRPARRRRATRSHRRRRSWWSGGGRPILPLAGTVRHPAATAEGIMLDYLIRGGTIVDGTGAAPRRGDVGIRGDRVVAVGSVDESARETLDADGLVVAPGFVDPHTHYDAQL